MVASTSREGHGKLNVTNGNADYAAVILASDSAQVTDWLVYVRAGMSATMNRIPTGTYRLMFQIGGTWDDMEETFKCASATGVFDRAAAFEEQEKADRVEYTEISITLHKLIGGNARTLAFASEPISPAPQRFRRVHELRWLRGSVCAARWRLNSPCPILCPPCIWSLKNCGDFVGIRRLAALIVVTQIALLTHRTSDFHSTPSQRCGVR
jgi:hypothetical protein